MRASKEQLCEMNGRECCCTVTQYIYIHLIHGPSPPFGELTLSENSVGSYFVHGGS